jgi:hypothetical protein
MSVLAGDPARREGARPRGVPQPAKRARLEKVLRKRARLMGAPRPTRTVLTRVRTGYVAIYA